MVLFDDARKQDTGFVDRRGAASSQTTDNSERRQFGNSHVGLSPDALELAQAIDSYKMKYRRRFITCEEMLNVIQSLGYTKPAEVPQPCTP